MDTTSIDVFVEISGISTERLLANCLYIIDDPDEIGVIVNNVRPERLFRATQRKAMNWLMFKFPDQTSLKTDLDEDACELRITTKEWIHEYRISEEACGQLSRHIQKARSLYDRAYRIEDTP